MSIPNLTIGGSHKRPHPPLFEEGPTSKRHRLNDSHTPGLEKLISAATMDDQEEYLVTVICELGTCLLENKPDVASAKFVEEKLAKVSSTNPRTDTLSKEILEIKASNAHETLAPNRLPINQPSHSSPVNEESELRSLGDALRIQVLLFSGPEQLTKLDEAQTKLTASLVIDPNNAFALSSLGDVLRLQAHTLSGDARLAKLNKAQEKYEAALKLDDLRKLLKPKKTQVENGRSFFLKIHS